MTTAAFTRLPGLLSSTGKALVLPDSQDENFCSTPKSQDAQPARIPDELNAANAAFVQMQANRGGHTWSSVRDLYQAFIDRPPTGATTEHIAEAMFFIGRSYQEQGLVPAARHAFGQLLTERFNGSPFQTLAVFRRGEISLRAGGNEIAVDELQDCLTRLGTGAHTGELRFLRPMLAEANMRSGNYGRAMELYRLCLGEGIPAEVRTRGIQGVARLAELAARGAVAADQTEERTRLWAHATSALTLLQRDHATNEVTPTVIRAVAAIAFRHADSGTDATRWQRARDLFAMVHALGATSPHRPDALFLSGICEFRLGNFGPAGTHFANFVTTATTDPRRDEAQTLARASRAEAAFALARAATVPADRVTNLQTSLTALGEITGTHHQVYVRNLAVRVGADLLPRLDPGTNPKQLTDTLTSLRAILGDAAFASSQLDALLHSTGRGLLNPSGRAPTAAETARGIAFLRASATAFPGTRVGQMCAIEVARAEGNGAALTTAGQALRALLPEPSATMLANDRTLWIYATAQIVLGQVMNGRPGDATATLAAANRTLTDANLGTGFQAFWRDTCGAAWGELIVRGQAIVAKARPSAAELTVATACFTFLLNDPGTAGREVRGLAHYGRGQCYEHSAAAHGAAGRAADQTADIAQALARYRQIPLLYPPGTFTAAPFVRLRSLAADAVTRLQP